jgi:hypothetical protein
VGFLVTTDESTVEAMGRPQAGGPIGMTPMRVRAAACSAVAIALAGACVAAAAGGASRGAATCGHQSSAGFPNAYADAHNLVVGPLALIGGRVFSSPEAVRRLGGQKYPALVAPGHTVKVAISPRARRTTALTYADGVHGSRRLERGVRVVTFRACDRRHAQSTAGGRPVTFWSGFVLASAPRCLHLKIWIDGARTARRARIPLGRRC